MPNFLEALKSVHLTDLIRAICFSGSLMTSKIYFSYLHCQRLRPDTSTRHCLSPECPWSEFRSPCQCRRTRGCGRCRTRRSWGQWRPCPGGSWRRSCWRRRPTCRWARRRRRDSSRGYRDSVGCWRRERLKKNRKSSVPILSISLYIKQSRIYLCNDPLVGSIFLGLSEFFLCRHKWVATATPGYLILPIFQSSSVPILSN